MDENFNQQNGGQQNFSQPTPGGYQQGNVQPQGNYQQPSYQPPSYPQNDELPLSVGEWFITMLIMAIPCAGTIMMFVWAFGDGNKSRKNFMRAALIWALIGIVIYVIILVAFGAVFASLINNSNYRY